MEKTSIQVYKSDLPRINKGRSDTQGKALSQPSYIKYLLDKEELFNQQDNE